VYGIVSSIYFSFLGHLAVTESMSFYPREMFFTSESVTEGHPDKLCVEQVVRQLGNDIGHTSRVDAIDELWAKAA
jgi:hypothetical protein